MKKYRVGGSIFIVIFMIIWCVFVGLMTSAIFSFAQDDFSFAIIIPIFMFAFGLVFLVSSFVQFRRMQVVLRFGKDATGIVTRLYLSGRANRTIYYILEFEYETENGDKAICVTSLLPKYERNVKEGCSIPIKVYKKYAYYDINALESNVIDDYTAYSSFDLKVKYCSKCGAKNNSDANYCNKCGEHFYQ